MNYKSETPRTTLRYEADKYTQGAFSAYENMRDLAKELEVELAEEIESRDYQLRLNVELNEREKQTHAELTAVTEQRDEARKLAEKYRYLSCDSQEEADETILPWENNNKPTKQCVARSAEDSEAQDKTETDDALWVALQFKKP